MNEGSIIGVSEAIVVNFLPQQDLLPSLPLTYTP